MGGTYLVAASGEGSAVTSGLCSGTRPMTDDVRAALVGMDPQPTVDPQILQNEAAPPASSGEPSPDTGANPVWVALAVGGGLTVLALLAWLLRHSPRRASTNRR